MSDSQNNANPEAVDPTGASDIPNPRGYSTRERLEAILESRANGISNATPATTSSNSSGRTERDGSVVVDGVTYTPAMLAAAEARAPKTPEEYLAAHGRLHDDKADLGWRWGELTKTLKEMIHRYESHYFDSATGTKIYRLTSSERAQLQREILDYTQVLERDRLHLAALNLQRTNDRERAAQVERDLAQAEADRKLRALARADELMVEEEAKALVAERLKKQRGGY